MSVLAMLLCPWVRSTECSGQWGGPDRCARSPPRRLRMWSFKRFAATPLSGKRLSHLGLGNSKLPRDCGSLDASLESGSYRIQFARAQGAYVMFRRRLSHCCRWWPLSCRPRRPSTAALGLGGNGCKQRIDFGIIQTLKRSGQVAGQQIARLRSNVVRFGFARWNDRRPGPLRRWSRNPVWCCLCRSPCWHNPQYAAAVPP